MASWFDETITPEERKEVEACVAKINEALNVGTLLAEALPDFIDARMGGHGEGQT
jgi:hypothetical protein